MKKILLLALLAVPTLFAAPAPDAKFAEVERLMKVARKAMLIPRIAVTVVEHDQIVWSGADGMADLEQRVPATPQTVWRIASVSKPVAATAIMQLVEPGKIKLDEPIWTAGGVLATAADLARFAAAIDTGKILKAETLKLVYTENKLSDGKPAGYGLGWHVATDKDGRLWVEHSGGATGGAAYLLRCPSEGLAISILCNLERPGDPKKLSMDMARAVMTTAK